MKNFIAKYLLQNELAGDGSDLPGAEADLETGEENTGEGLAPSSGEHQTKNEDGEDDGKTINQDKVNAAINKQHFLRKEEERKRLDAEKRAQELEEKLAKLQGADEIVIPEVPDPFDENYEQKVKERDEAIRQKTEQDALKQRATEQQEADKQAAEQAKVDAFNAKAETYKGRITTLGLTPETIQQAGEVVAGYINNMEVIEFILDHEDGPLITEYLSKNPVVMDELSRMTPMQAALKIQSDVAQSAALLKPKAPGAPDPLEELGGRGAGGDKVSPFIAGAKFE